MNNYFIIFFGWLIGQVIFTVISAYILQRKLEGINYIQAIKVFVEKEMGNYFIAIAGLFALMFMLNDFVNPHITRQDLLNKEVLSLKEKIIVYSRTASILFGVFVQFILLVGFKKGINGIKDYAAKNNIKDPLSNGE